MTLRAPHGAPKAPLPLTLDQVQQALHAMTRCPRSKRRHPVKLVWLPDLGVVRVDGRPL